ncbi:MAG: glycosyltransferase family 39 protein [Candidatus Latescibacteria bacterium]|nr:glycosyltransferase family 39 protein [Candidatus Latescibacterota bacterium]
MTRDRVVWTIAAAALIVRITLAAAAVTTAGVETLHAPDTSGYLEPASELLSDGTYTRAGKPEIVRTPGYSLLLIPGLMVDRVEGVTIFLQAMLAGLTVIAVYGLALELYHRRAAGAAAAIYALEPLSVLYASKLLSETLFTACLTWALLLLTRLAGRRDDPFQPLVATAAGAGLLLSGAAMVKPVAYPVALVVGLSGAWFAMRRSAPPRTRWRPVLLLTVTAIVPLLAWQGRNAVVADYGGLSAIVDVNGYFYQGAATEAAAMGIPFYERQATLGYRDLEVYLEANPEQRSWSPGRRFQFMGREGLARIFEHPLTYLGIHARGMARVAVDPGGVEYLRLLGAYPTHGGLLGRVVDEGLWATLGFVLQERPGLLLTEVLFGAFLVAVYLLTMRGVIIAEPRSRRAWAVCLLLAGYLWFATGGPQSLSRFRHPIMPIMCALAGAGLATRKES